MNVKKVLISLFLLSFLSNFIFSYTFTIEHDEADGAKLYYCSEPKLNTDNCQSFTGEEILQISNFNFPVSDSYYKKIFTYKENKRLVFGINTYDNFEDFTESRLNDVFNAYFTPYLTPISVRNVLNANGDTSGKYVNQLPSFYNEKDLKNNICKIFYNFTTKNITSSLKPITKISGGSYDIPENLLKKYYFINTTAKIFLNNGSIITKYFVIGDSEKPLSEVYAGSDYLAIDFLPNDLKCDFGNDGELNSSEIQGVFYNKPITEINNYFDNTINFLVNDTRKIKILNSTLKVNPIIKVVGGKTTITANLSKLGNSAKNISIYFLLNKTSWGNLSEKNISDLRSYAQNKFSSSSYNFTFFVVDKDPIIGYDI